MKLILEQRYLFDGSVGAVGHHGAHQDHHGPQHADPHTAPAGDNHAATLAAQDNHAAPLAAVDIPGAAARPAIQDQAVGPTSGVTTLLIIDPRVTNWQNLASSVKPGVDVVVLDPTKDGVSQVSQALQGLTGVKNLEFLTDGTPGAISLGGTTLNLSTMTARASDITGWSASLSPHADIVFWGCDVGQGSAGATFVADMHTLTGATIGASTDATGAFALGGNWNLEATTGDLHKDVQPFSAASIASYAGILDIPDPVVSMTVSGATGTLQPDTVFLGDTLNVNLTFTNRAANATGFGPFVELFAPASLTLTGTPTSGGASITPLSATITTSIGAPTVGHFIDPLTGAIETAPDNITSGTVYFLSLPYGSFTPGEPAVTVNASFRMADTPSLVGTSLLLDAQAGFQYGAVATGGTPIIGASTPISDSVVLIQSSLTVATQPGEGETATGPDFPVTYTLTIEPAPAIAHTLTPITGLSLSFVLPNSVTAFGIPVATGGGTASIDTSAVLAGGSEQTLHVTYASLPATETVTFTAYVPRNYNYTGNGQIYNTPILDPATGAPVTISVNPAYTYAASNWNSLAVGGTGYVAGATFEAKSLAVQLVADTSSALPTQDINYALKFEVSDYFGVSGLSLGAILGNGLTFDPTITPLLFVAGANGGVSASRTPFLINAGSETTVAFSDPVANSSATTETVQAGGSGPYMTYAFDGGTSATPSTTDGKTTVTFDVGGLLPGQFGAGTVGLVTLSATVLDRYPTQADNVVGAGGFLREADSVSASGPSDLNYATNLYDYAAGAYSAAGNPIADNTATPVDTLPRGTYSLSVAYVDGVAFTGQNIVPGDIVVYEMTYSLAAPGDFAGLTVTGYLPEPIFSILNPGNPDATGTADFAGSGTSIFTLSGSAASALTSGQYTYSLSAGLTGVAVTGGTGLEPANSVSFGLSDISSHPYYNRVGNSGAAQTVTIDFAVTASHLPFVDGLHLTAQGDSTFAPAQAGTFAYQQTQILYLNEPSILTIHQGVVSVVDDGNTDISGTPGIVWTLAGGAAAAPAVFAPAGGTSVFAPGAIVPSVLTPAQDNLDAAGAQAGDTVRIVDVVQNVGHYAAYDVILKDALSGAFTTGDVSKLTFTRGDGTVLEAIDPITGNVVTGATAINAYFGTGLLLAVPNLGTSTDAAAPALAAVGSGGDIVYVTYDVTLPALTPTAASLTGQATLVAWSNQNLFVPGSTTLTLPTGQNGNFALTPAISPAVTDTATVATLAPSIIDTITGASDLSDPSVDAAGIPANTFNTHRVTVVPGETINLTATISLPQGVNTNVAPIDILPSGLSLISTAGTYTATFTDNTGHSTDITAQISFSGNRISIPAANYTVPASISGGDRPSTITITYQALVPQTQAAPIDTSGWTLATTGDRTLTDTFRAPSEGVGYGTTTETAIATTTGTGTGSGIANTVVVTNPLVTATITESVSSTVYSGETIIYTLTLTNPSTSATAYDVGSVITLPSGLTYIAGSLTQTGGAAAIVNAANVGPGSANAVDGITLAPGGTSTFTFQTTVDNNLPAATALRVTSQPAWESLPASATFDPGNVNPQAQAYLGAQGHLTNTTGVVTPTLSVIGESNQTAGLGAVFDPAGTSIVSPVAVTDGEIVRMRAVLQVPEGQNNNVSMAVTLPTNLIYQNDGSTNVLLVSPNGDFSTSLTGAGLQTASGSTAIDPTRLGLALGGGDPVVTPLSGVGAIGVSGQVVTFSFGMLANNDGSPQKNYVIVEFNALVSDATVSGTRLTTTMTGAFNANTTASVSDYTQASTPAVTLTKVIDGIVYNPDGSATITYTDTERNTSTVPAYNLVLTDPGASVGTASYTGPAAAGNVTNVGASGSGFTATITTLAGSNTTQSFTYSVTIPQSQVETAVLDAAAQATLTSYALNPALETSSGTPAVLHETLAGTSVLPAQHLATATAGLDLVSGTVNQDLASVQGTGTPLQALAGQTVTARFAGQTVGTETVMTDASGNYALLVPDNSGAVSITVTTTSPNAPALDTLDNAAALIAPLPAATETGTNPATLTFSPAASTNYTHVVFDFWRALDTAPVLANGPGVAFTAVAGSPIVPFASATVSDAQLDTTFAHDFSGTTLTLQRYVGATATPDATDVFASTGSSSSGLFLSAGASGSGNVVLSGATVGTYTESGGVLSIKFGSGTTATTVDTVLNGIRYISTAGGNPTLPPIVIGAQIDDANNDPIALGGASLDPIGPHDQGSGGDLLSNVLTATVNVSPLAPDLSIIGSSNNTAGLGTSFDPTGRTTGTAVTTTDSEILRMRAVVQLPEGVNSAADIVVTLPTGLTYQTDGSANVLLVTPGGNAGTTLTGSGLQLAEGATPIDLTRLSLGTSSIDPVTARLTGTVGVVGQSVTFSLGTVTNPTSGTGPNYAIIEFNAVVVETTAATATPLATMMHADTNSVATPTANDYVNVIAPAVALTKTIENIAYNPDGTVTVTYRDTETNTGNAPAYRLVLDDPGAGPGTTVSYGGPAASGNVTSVGPNGSHFDATLSTLAAGVTQTFTYSVIIPANQITSAVSDSAARATLTSFALNPAHETSGQEALAGTSLTPPQHLATATAGLDLVSGTVSQDVSPNRGDDNPLVELEGQTVSVTFTGQTGTERTVTDEDGNFAVLVPDSGVPVTLTVTVTAPNAPTPDSLDNGHALVASVPGRSEVGHNPAALTFTPAPDTLYSPLAFDFWRPLDTAPVLSNGPTAPLADVTGVPVQPFATATVSDTQLDNGFGHDYSGTTLTLQRYVDSAAAPDASDVFTGTGSVTLSNGPTGSGNVLLGGGAVGTYIESNGVLTIMFAGSGVTATTVNSVLQGLAFSTNLSGNPLVPGIVIGAQIDDANNDPISLNGNALDPTGPHDQGPGGDMLSNVLMATIDMNSAGPGTAGGDLTIGTGPASTFIEPNDFAPARAAVTVDATADLTNIAHTGGTPSQVTMVITNAHPEDVLTFTNTTDISSVFSGGTLTLTEVGGHSPTLAEWQSAVRSVQYYDTSDVPNPTTRDITVTVTAGGNTATERATVAIIPVNDSPILDNSVAVSLNDATEYQGFGAPIPSGPVGTLVGQIAGLHGGAPGNVTDPDGANQTNGATATVPGIAITGFNTSDPGGRSVGTWYYSINGGATWAAFSSTISAAHPLDLAATARIAFQPTATDFNGQIPNAITFKAWDGFDGTANGRQGNLSDVTALGQSAPNNTAATAYSIASDTLPLTIINVNNAPDAVGSVSLPPVSTTDQHPPGQTVSQLFNAGFTDPLDHQLIPVANPLGSFSNGFAGIAVTANAATHNQGVWEYSLDNGATWTAIPTNVSQSSAVILPSNARIAFQPLGGFSGYPGKLSVNLIDSSATTVAPGLTGAQLAAEGTGGIPLTALTGVAIPEIGGSTAFSATPMALGTLVNPTPPITQHNAAFDARAPRDTRFPDDLFHEPGDLGFWTTDDFLGRPLIPDLSLVGSVANRFIIVEQHAVISVPPNIFQDSLPQAQLSYEAKRPDGSSLPSWITFNANDLTFTGTPPRGAYGRLEILIRARDIAGRTADATFNILIGRQQDDLVALLKPGHHPRLFLPIHAANAAHGLQQATAALASAEQKLAEHQAQAVHHVAAQAALLADLPSGNSQAGGFSSALHAAGPMSALGRARAWLDTLNDMDRHKPAT